MDIGNARSDPDLFLQNFAPPLILDEIQYAPELISGIKRYVDRLKRPGMYILTGSQQWQILESTRESLAGRAVFLDLDGFSLHEIDDIPFEKTLLEHYLDNPEETGTEVAAGHGTLEREPSLYEQLWRGFLPDAQSIETTLVSDYLQSYYRSYVERDARALSAVSDWQLFSRFVRLAAALTSQEINHSQLGREIGVMPQTAKRWLAMLIGTFQWYEIPAFHGNTIKRISRKPKGYISDTGMAASLQSISSPTALSGHPLLGALFETAVVSELRKQAAVLPVRPQMYHWRTQAGSEVDIVLERDGGLYPIEVKLTSHPTKSDTRGLRAFRDTYPDRSIAPGLVICATDRPFYLNEKEIAVPWDWRPQ